MLLKTGSAHGDASSRDLLNWMDVSAACPQTNRVGGEMAIGVANLHRASHVRSALNEILFSPCPDGTVTETMFC
jgi:hypothetical protein